MGVKPEGCAIRRRGRLFGSFQAFALRFAVRLQQRRKLFVQFL
jgi:hypothetical protein